MNSGPAEARDLKQGGDAGHGTEVTPHLVRPGPAPTMWARGYSWLAPVSPGRYLVAILAIAVAAWGSYFAGRGLSSPHDQFDLKIYDAAVRFWTSGHNLYDYAQPDSLMGSLGFTYPPLAAVLMSPMSLLSWRAVQSITVIAIALAGAAFCYLLLQDSIRMRGPQGLLIVGVATSVGFLFEPIRENISYGQVNLFLGLMVVFDVFFLARRYPRLFGIGIGLAAAIKLTPAIFILYLVLTKRWRPAITAAITAVVLSLAAAVVAWSEVWDFFTSILWDTSRVGHPDSVFNQSINGLLARLASPDLPSRRLWVLLSIILAVFGLWRARKVFLAGDDLAGMTITGMVGLMVSPVSWTHHAVWVLPAVVVLLHRAWELGRDFGTADPTTRRQFWSLVGLTFAGLGWTIEAHHYVTDRTRDWSVATWSDHLLATLPTLWCLAIIALLPARKLVPAWSAAALPRVPARH